MQTRADLRLTTHHLAAPATDVRELAGARADRDGFIAVLDRLAQGVMLVEADSRVRFANHVAAAILSTRDGLSLDHDRLRAATIEATARLRRQISLAAAPNGSGGGLALPRPSLRKPLVALVEPMRADALWLVDRRPGAMLFLSDPERIPVPRPSLLRQIWGLTPMEAAVASRVLTGDSVVESAANLEISINTARTHLQHVFDKAGVRRQADLVRLALSAGILANPDALPLPGDAANDAD